MAADTGARPAAREFRWPVRVYYEDTDAAGLVYHSNFLKFMERTRTEWLRDLGHSQGDLRAAAGMLFVVRHVELDFLRPARLDQLLEVTARVVRRGGASMRVEQAVRDEAGLLCHGIVDIVCIDAVTLKPKRLPKFIREELDHVH